MLASTQDHLPIKDIKNDVVILKDGSTAVVLQTSAVNFGPLSENEQLAIISSFAGMLNSLSFMIQIIIRSKRLDISTYLKQLDEAQLRQANPLLASMIGRYREFIRNTIQENDVLDKQFYIIVPVSYLETGAITKDINYDFKKAMTILLPRRDQIIRQLARVGLKTTQLNTEELIRLFYDIYNPAVVPNVKGKETAPQPQVQARQQVVAPQPVEQPVPTPQEPLPQQPPTQPQVQVAPTPQPQVQSAPVAPNYQRRKPFVVEELPEDYGSV